MTTTTRNYLTLGEFVATRREVDDIMKEVGGDDDMGVRGGFVYEGGCYIEREGNGVGYFLVIERSTWEHESDLAKLERILWAEHYLLDTADVILRTDDATLDHFACAVCDAFAKPVDGDLFGVLFSGKPDWTPSEAREVIVNSFTYASGDDAALPVAERLQMMADRKADDVPTGGQGVQSGASSGGIGMGVGVQSAPLTLTAAELTNLITACNTSAMRKDSPEWQAGLDAIAAKLYAARDALDRAAVRS